MEPYMADFSGLFKTPNEFFYTDEFSMVSKSVNRLHHGAERVEIINSLLDELRDKHTHIHRISGIFEYLE